MCEETNGEPETTTKKGRPAGKPNKAKRQNYADDLKRLQSKVDTAVNILTRAKSCTEETRTQLIDVALEMLGEK